VKSSHRRTQFTVTDHSSPVQTGTPFLAFQPSAKSQRKRPRQQTYAPHWSRFLTHKRCGPVFDLKQIQSSNKGILTRVTKAENKNTPGNGQFLSSTLKNGLIAEHFSVCWMLLRCQTLHTSNSCFTLLNSYDSQLKTRKKLWIISQNFRKLNLDPNTKSPLKRVTALSILKDYCWNSEKFRFRLSDSFSFQKFFNLYNMSCRYAIQSWLHQGMGELHVNVPTLVGPMETSRLQTILVWNWKRKLGRQNFKFLLTESRILQWYPLRSIKHSLELVHH